MTDAGARGRFVWYDLMTSDSQKAVPFYTKVIGWGTQEWEGMPYTMWTANGRPIGGVGKLEGPPGTPPHWLAYVAVPDVDAAAKQVDSLGGRTIVKPQDIPSVGRYAVHADPFGAVFATFKPSSPDSSPTGDDEKNPKIGEFSWHELMTTDYGKAFAFYQTMFGWDKIVEHDMGPMGIYMIFGRNGVQLGGMFNKPADMPAPPNWLHYIRVDSADRVADVVKSAGGTVMNGPMEVPGGDRIAQCMDPQDAAFAIHAKKA
jgi:predicted enzyme related to lactoylglutathione lyase